MIHDHARFADVVLPHYFLHSNYQSFVRQVQFHSKTVLTS